MDYNMAEQEDVLGRESERNTWLLQEPAWVFDSNGSEVSRPGNGSGFGSYTNAQSAPPVADWCSSENATLSPGFAPRLSNYDYTIAQPAIPVTDWYSDGYGILNPGYAIQPSHQSGQSTSTTPMSIIQNWASPSSLGNGTSTRASSIIESTPFNYGAPIANTPGLLTSDIRYLDGIPTAPILNTLSASFGAETLNPLGSLEYGSQYIYSDLGEFRDHFDSTFEWVDQQEEERLRRSTGIHVGDSVLGSGYVTKLLNNAERKLTMELDLFAIHMDFEQVVLKANYPVVNESMPYVQLRGLSYFLPQRFSASYIAQAGNIATSFRIHPYDRHMRHGGFVSLIDAMRLAEAWQIYNRLKAFFSIVQRHGYNPRPNQRSLKLICSMCEEELEVISHLANDGYGGNRERMFDDHIRGHVSIGEAHETFICVKPDNDPKCFRVFGSRRIFEDHLERDHPNE